MGLFSWLGGGEANKVDYGKFTDSRDGAVYRTVKMPDGKIWMAQNINYKPDQGCSWCYDNVESNGYSYGRLYPWNDARRYAAPEGWHLPSKDEWAGLIAAVSVDNTGEKRRVDKRTGLELTGKELTDERLKSKTGWEKGWEGKDTYGFSAISGGYIREDNLFFHLGRGGYWWTSTEGDGETAYNAQITNCLRINSCDDVVLEKSSMHKSFSVRCVKND